VKGPADAGLSRGQTRSLTDPLDRFKSP
jgi:hypothetical protein